MTRFTQGQDVAVVEHDPATHQPLKGGMVFAEIIASTNATRTTIKGGETKVIGLKPGPFDTATGWAAWTGAGYRWRLVALCYFCGEPVTGEPVTQPEDPAPKRTWCTEDCREDSAEAWAGQHYPSGVAT